MKLLAIDYGTKKNGLSISNQKGTIVFPYGVIDNSDRLIDDLREIIKKEGIEKVIVGTPSYNQQTDFYTELENFISTLKTKIEIDVDTQDELLTSEAAKKVKSPRQVGGQASGDNKKNSHEAAAMLILEDYIKRSK